MYHEEVFDHLQKLWRKSSDGGLLTMAMAETQGIDSREDADVGSK